MMKKTRNIVFNGKGIVVLLLCIIAVTTTAFAQPQGSQCGSKMKDYDASGFSAVPAGDYYAGFYYYFGFGAYLWSATPYGSDIAYYLYLGYYYKSTLLDNYYRYNGFSVRCLSDK